MHITLPDETVYLCGPSSSLTVALQENVILCLNGFMFSHLLFDIVLLMYSHFCFLLSIAHALNPTFCRFP